MTDDVNQRIEVLRTEIEEMRGPLFNAHTDFARAARTWAAEFWPKQAEAVVTAHPERAKELGVEGLRKLKADLSALVDDATPRTTKQFLHETFDLWPHLQDDMTVPAPGERKEKSWSDSQFTPQLHSGPSARQPDVLADPARRLLGEVAQVLRDHDFPTTRDPDRTYRSFTKDGPEYYQRAWSEGMLTAIGVYAELHDQLVAKRIALKAAEREREEGEAKSLWDQA